MKSKTVGWIILVALSFILGYIGGFPLLDCIFKMVLIFGGTWLFYQSINLIEGGKFGELRQFDKEWY
jgi:hypothetical protein